jgi:hypothetical protein
MPSWKFQPESFDSSNASTFRKLMLRQELSAEELIAREIIQNSDDAADQLRRELDDQSLPFYLTFQFRRVEGKQKQQFFKHTGVDSLFKLARQVGQETLGIKATADLERLLGSGPLEILEMSDFGARGLKTSPKAMKKSAYYNCLLTIGQSKDKHWSSGGSYGFGKSAFINGSRVGIVLAYSCFQPTDKNDTATRRFGGVAYWSDFSLPGKGTNCTGLAAFGDPKNQHEWIDLPYEDEKADELAELCGLQKRDKDDPTTWGTTLLILCPAAEPEELHPAIEKFWWPALIGPNPRMKVTVTDYDGVSKTLSPKQNPLYRHFIRSYELATTDAVARGPYEMKQPIGNPELGEKFGVFAAVADPNTCFDPKRADGSSKEGHVCLVRAPRMIVKYVEYGRGAAAAPFIEGIFVSTEDHALEKVLQAAEPPTHDYWWPKERTKQTELKRNDPEIHKVVFSIKKGLDQAVNAMKAQIKPPTVKEKTGLKNFGKLLSRLMSDDGDGPKPPPPVEPFSIEFLDGPSPSAALDGGVSYTTDVEIAINSEAEKQEYELQIQFIYSVVQEEDRDGEVISCDSELMTSPGLFSGSPLVGLLKKGQSVRIRFKSESIDAGKSVSAQCRVKQRTASRSSGGAK